MTTHKHELIRDELLEDIVQLPTDAPLPQERELAERFLVSRTTVRQALKALTDEGRIYAIRGRGTFVASQRISKNLRLTSFTDDMQNRGLKPGTRLLQAKEISSDPQTAAMLEISAGSRVIHLERLRLADGFPMCFESIWLPSRLYRGLLTQELEQPLYGLLATKYNIRIERAEQKIAAENIEDRIADLLAVPHHSAALAVTRRGFDGRNRVAEYAKSIYRSDRYDFEVAVSR